MIEKLSFLKDKTFCNISKVIDWLKLRHKQSDMSEIPNDVIWLWMAGDPYINFKNW